jgi:acyl-CoA hydrolase
MSAVNFEAPAVLGDIIEVGCDVVKFGSTSITVKAVIRNKTTKKNICTVEEIVFVALDENGKPTPHGKTYELKD